MARRRKPTKSAIPVREDVYLLESAWEVCNQVGGIYTVIRSKVSAVMKEWSNRYCMVGPFVSKNILAELEEINVSDDPFIRAADKLRKEGYKVIYAEWLVTGRPRVILLDIQSISKSEIEAVYQTFLREYNIAAPAHNTLIRDVLLFSWLAIKFVTALSEEMGDKNLIAHYHEWMSGLPILHIRKKKLPVRTVFTTHATILGRYLAYNSPYFYEHLPFFNVEEEAKKFGIETEAKIEGLCANKADVFTTVSDVTAKECVHLLKRKPHHILPNGLNIERFEALHEVQNLHALYKEEIHRFVMGHFFHSYSFDLNKTLYFFTSGRYEYKNKGFDLTLEALSLLNKKLKDEEADITVVMFFVTRREFTSIKSDVLQSRAVMEEISETCEAIQQQVGRGLFYAGTTSNENRLPNLNEFVDEYWSLRYRRTIQSWKSNTLPSVITHNLVNEDQDDIMRSVKKYGLLNEPADKVKIVYHPDFITATNPLFGIEYTQFVRGCHLGIFPSYYEPWGYTPLESMACGVPAITSDLAGFGNFLKNNMPEHEESGMYVITREGRSFESSARRLAVVMHEFLQQSRRERILQRNQVENSTAMFDWQELIRYYNEAYELVLKKKK